MQTEIAQMICGFKLRQGKRTDTDKAWADAMETAGRILALTDAKHEAPAEGAGERERLADAYIAGAMSVHEYWTENPGEAPHGDPEFDEAAGDYAYSVHSDLRARSSAPEAREGEAWTEDMERERREADYERGFRHGKEAVRLKWRTDNPVDEVKVAMPKSRVTIWEQADVDTYVWAALAAGNPDLAAIILTEWEIGQRLTDVVLFRRGAEYVASEGMFSFDQSKTSQPVAIPVSDRLRAILAMIERPGSLYLFHDTTAARSTASLVLDMLFEGQRTGVIPSAVQMGKTLGVSDVSVGKALRKLRVQGCVTKIDGGLQLKRPNWDDGAKPFANVERLSHVFGDIRTRFVLPAGGRHLVLRAIRHSCVVQLARHGAEVPEIVSVTGHSLSSANEILKVYMPRDSKVAMNAQRKRGLVA